jgi:hypothetical protein
VWFPSSVKITAPTFTTEYTLVTADFNASVDPMEARLPSGTRLADQRFNDPRKVVNYKLIDGVIPTDAQVEKMLGENQTMAQAKNKATEEGLAHTSRTRDSSNQSLPVMPFAGLMCMALGGMLWTRSRHKSENL